MGVDRTRGDALPATEAAFFAPDPGVATWARNRQGEGKADMRIQEEIPLPSSPFVTFERDYETAVVHLAWDHCQKGEGVPAERTLLFAFVELLPKEIPPPEDDYQRNDRRFCERLGNKSAHRVSVRHAVVPAKDALVWYLDCRRGVAVLPVDEGGRFPAPDATDAKRLRLADLGEEPPWPALICAADDSETIPFAPDWAECPRVHHLVSLADFHLDGLWTKSEQERAVAWLEDHLHFSLKEYPEYWGSVHLVAPNPVYRHIHAGRQKRGQGESVLLRFEPRAGMSVEGLKLIYRGANASGTLYEHVAPVQSRLVRMRFEHRADAFQADVIDGARGMLSNSNLLTGFLGDMDLTMTLAGTFDVKGPTPESTYSVPRSRPLLDRQISQETAKVASTELRLTEARRRRHTRAATDGDRQRWFRGQQEEAREILRGILHGAEREVLIVDPYFGYEELWVFTLAVGREDVPVMILASNYNNVLERLVEKDGQKIEQGDLMLEQLQRFREHPHMNPFEIKVMAGGIHDRFLLVDNRIWLLGSSLNEFGSRGTMMVALPDPDAVREQLLKTWDDAVPLEAWVERRKRGRKKDEEAAP